MRRLWLLVALVGMIGCSKPDANGETENPAPTASQSDPAEAVYEQVRSGFVQLGNSLESLGDALETAKKGQGSSDAKLKEYSDGIAEFLDLAGSHISDYTEPPESLEAFNEKFKEYDDNRLKAIDGANDSLHEIGEARGILADMEADPKLEKEQVVLDLADLLTDAEKSLKDAIITMGGKVEEPSTY